MVFHLPGDDQFQTVPKHALGPTADGDTMSFCRIFQHDDLSKSRMHVHSIQWQPIQGVGKLS